MRILFICAGFQPGLDGVGDYVRLLAESLEALGHAVAVLALNDKSITNAAEDEQSPRPVLQLPSAMSWRARSRRARTFVRHFAPDWVSVQFVCYGFGYQGLPVALPSRLRRIMGDVKAQIMFHELVVGIGAVPPLKHRLLGVLQRESVIKPLARMPQVKRIATNIAPHAQVLASWGIRAQVLPLFGNIPIVDATEEQRARWWASRFGVQRSDVYAVGIFGSVKGEVLPDTFMETLLATAQAKGLQLLVAGAGHLTGPGEEYFDFKKAQYAGRALFQKLGRLPADEVSLFLSSLDLGIASSPWLYVGKSGSVAAMLEHGLPVAVSRNDLSIPGITDNGFEGEDQLACFADRHFATWLQSARRVPARDRRAGIAARFAESLTSDGWSP